MTRVTHNGLTLWYDTEGANTPCQRETLPGEVTITVGVQPPQPGNRVVVHYRIDGGPLQTLSAILTSTDYAGAAQYFRARWTGLPAQGAEVRFCPVLSCAGRQAPDVATVWSLPTSFHYAGVPTPPQTPIEAVAPAADSRFPFRMEFLGTVTARLDKNPEIIGETPEGLKVDWYITGGRVVGPRLNAVVRAEGGDWMTVRRDGIGDVNVRATLETHDGALISVRETGVFDLGENGYHRFLERQWPATPPLRTCPRFLTAHPGYLWLNRLECLGVGLVRMAELLVCYDLYAVH